MKPSKSIQILSTFLLAVTYNSSVNAQGIDGFQFWSLGKDAMTDVLEPAKDHFRKGAIIEVDGNPVAYAKFKVDVWGEMYTPLLQTSRGSESPVDISDSKFVTIEYASNREVMLQLRHAFIHGGTHNHVMLPDSQNAFTKLVIPFEDFKGGLTPLDLSNVSKFDFAFIGPNKDEPYSELSIKHIQVDNFTPTN